MIECARERGCGGPGVVWDGVELHQRCCSYRQSDGGVGSDGDDAADDDDGGGWKEDGGMLLSWDGDRCQGRPYWTFVRASEGSSEQRKDDDEEMHI